MTQQIDQVTARVRSKSELDLASEGSQVVESIVDQLFSSVVQKGESIMTRPRQCHHCHRPTNHSEHAGIGAGSNNCTLDHYDLCPGGRQSSVDWTGCPADDEVYAEGLEGNIINGIEENLNHPKPERLSLDPEALAKSLLEASQKAEQVVLDRKDNLEQESDDGSTDDEEEEILMSEIEQLKIQVEKSEIQRAEQEKAKAKADRKEQKRMNRKKLEDVKANLLRQVRTSKEDTPPQAQLTNSSDLLQEKAAALAGKRQKQAAEERASRQRGSAPLTIGDIRGLPGMRR